MKLPPPVRHFIPYYLIFYVLPIVITYVTIPIHNQGFSLLMLIISIPMLNFGLCITSFIYGLRFQSLFHQQQRSIFLYTFTFFVLSLLAMYVWFPPTKFVENMGRGFLRAFAQTAAFVLGSQIAYVVQVYSAKKEA